MVGAHAPVNAAPTVAQPISVNGNAAVTGKTASLSVLGSDDGGEAKLVYTWSVTAAPAGGTATFSINGTNAAKNMTATFTKAGTYSLTVKIVDAGGLSVSSTKTVVVSPTLTSISVSTASGQVVSPGSALAVSGVEPDDRRPGLGPVRQCLGHAARFHLVDHHGSQRRADADFGHQRRRRHGHVRQGRDLRAGGPGQGRGRRFGHSQRVDDGDAGGQRRQESYRPLR